MKADRTTSAIRATFTYPAVTESADNVAAQRQQFEQFFHHELQNIRAWSERAHWKQLLVPNLQVIVSDEYKISRALVHVWGGHPGRMEFPTWRVITGTAAVAHELAHVFFPNGNRLLAEGLAVYLQSATGDNPAFPNFGRPLHALARDFLQKMVPDFFPRRPKSSKRAPSFRIG